jgi:acyl-CoA synthetase (AMP-forming)/AMP-acid ligase II
MKEWVTPGNPNLGGSPVAHATGMLGAVLSPLCAGQSIHLIDRWDPAHALEVMRAAKIGGGSGASVFLASLIDHPDFTPEHARLMARVGLGGAPVPIPLAERAAAHGIAIIRAYGSTEHPSTTGGVYGDPAEKRHRTDGRACPGVELRLVDEAGADVAAGKPGEILSRGPDLCLGYTDPELTAAAFDADGWYRTGDIGHLDDAGRLILSGRVKDIIVLPNGFNVYPEDIENALRIAGIRDSVVIEIQPGRIEAVVLGSAAGAPGAVEAADPVELRGRLDAAVKAANATLGPNQRIAGWRLWPEEDFPRTHTLKIKRGQVRAWVAADNPLPVA